jgi:hypothetical protein
MYNTSNTHNLLNTTYIPNWWKLLWLSTEDSLKPPGSAKLKYLYVQLCLSVFHYCWLQSTCNSIFHETAISPCLNYSTSPWITHTSTDEQNHSIYTRISSIFSMLHVSVQIGKLSQLPRFQIANPQTQRLVLRS